MGFFFFLCLVKRRIFVYKYDKHLHLYVRKKLNQNFLSLNSLILFSKICFLFSGSAIVAMFVGFFHSNIKRYKKRHYDKYWNICSFLIKTNIISTRNHVQYKGKVSRKRFKGTWNYMLIAKQKENIFFNVVWLQKLQKWREKWRFMCI